MPKLSKGQKMPDLIYQTAHESGLKLSDAVKRVSGKTAIQFLRYYGCRACQLDIITYTEEYDKIIASGGQVVIVLQSDPKKLAGWTEGTKLPFDIICDPDQTFYKEFEIKPAASKEEMHGPRSDAKKKKFEELGLVHGEYEGEELQLPATFVVDHDLNITYAHYAKTTDDVPDPAEMAALLK